MQDRRRTVLRLPQHTVPVLLRERQSSSATGSAGAPGAGSTGPRSGSPSDPQSDQQSGPQSGSASGSPSDPQSGSPSGSPSDPQSGSPSGSPSDPQSGSPSGAGSGTGPAPDDNPFAPPPEGSTDQPWRPRHHPYPNGSDSSTSSASSTNSSGGRNGSDRGAHGSGPEGDGQGNDANGTDGRGNGDRPAWGSQWSDRQPGRSGGGFGGRPGGHGPYGPDPRQGQDGGQGGPGRGGMRWDPKDVYQRRARYALLAGIWGFFFALFSIPEVALLLGALAVYWAVSSLRAKNRTQTPDEPDKAPGTRRPDPFATPSHPAAYQSTQDRAYASAGVHHTPQQLEQQQGRPQHTAAVSGLVAAILALLVVAGTYSLQFVYSDYYSCVHTALTHEGQVSCNNELPKSLVPMLGISK